MTPAPSTAPLTFEREGWERGLEWVAGVDEAGRGPLAGPVLAAAVVLHPDQSFEGATDSKLLDAAAREALAERILADARAWGLGAASCREIERLNVLRAAGLAMRRALAHLGRGPELLLVDGRGMPGLGDQRAIVHGDLRSHSIACASILAKVFRDRLMHRLHPRYPDYGWATNHGYGTPEHMRALARHGPTPHHRRTWAPVQQVELPLEG
ncbi:MAG TPA: ribonuclease HII [Gemmatimonadota bacterium]|nr:ribonuclease HII [Gemmatimonadota bacterium]